ncbi:MAG: hypothetical protein KDB23_23110, partial [Planctomycetales bacterium]|nr:hypothetical protein [Planctomycetales bacterium]
ISVDAHTVTHSDRVVVFGRDGKICGSYRVLIPTEFKELEQQVAALFAEDETAADAQDATTEQTPDGSPPSDTEASAATTTNSNESEPVATAAE